MTLTFLFSLLLACGGETPPSSREAEAAPVVAPPAAPPAPVAAAGTAEPALLGDAAAGKAVYEQHCTACHQADGTGMGGMLAANFKTDTARLAKSDAELLKSIREGVSGKVGTMPPWGATLSPQQQADVLAHIRASYGSK